MKIASQKLANSKNRILTENRGISQTLAIFVFNDDFDQNWRILTENGEF